MENQPLLDIVHKNPHIKEIAKILKNDEEKHIQLNGLRGSAPAVYASAIYKVIRGIHLFVMPDKEEAAYFYNDLEHLFDESDLSFDQRRILFFPTTYRKPYEIEKTDNSNVVLRAEVLNKISTIGKDLLIVTYPEALGEMVVTKNYLKKNTLTIRQGDDLGQDFVLDVLVEYGFERVDFVIGPGQFSLRGGIIDVFSFSSDLPYRIEFFGDEVESIRSFKPSDQLSVKMMKKVSLMPDIQDRTVEEKRESFLDFLPSRTILWLNETDLCADTIASSYKNAEQLFNNLEGEVSHLPPNQLFVQKDGFLNSIAAFKTIELGKRAFFPAKKFAFNTESQPHFNKNFDMLLEAIKQNYQDRVDTWICSGSQRQLKRIHQIFEDIREKEMSEDALPYKSLNLDLHAGFIDADVKLACYTDHQIFDRYHRFRLRDDFSARESISLKEIYNLQKGDFVTHIDHGVGRFDGLETIENNGKRQEVIRLIYRNEDLLYVSIHSLHRIAKYVGKEGTSPSLNKLGTKTWATTRNKTRKKLKDIARELIKLYAKRKASEGFAFAPDTYLQHELEASFIYEDTPDQQKSTAALKKDMESDVPMDRLICGDVGFGKTEVAIRAAFKAVADSKQVAVLVPTTILALQHYRTFTERLEEFPCTIDYINRFKSSAKQKESLEKLKKGEIDIIIGTHRLIGKDVQFSDLGLLIIDEEQKFGVSAKEKLRNLKLNVDTLTLTATPIPRTLQFSMMGARDLSVINTPPPNRQAVQTEIRPFNEEIVRDAILFEVNRGGQVFFVHNRVQNIIDVAGMIKRFCPDVKVAIAHGQMDGKKLEQVMLDFIDHEYDVLVATTIIESGLDIPNVNTILINDAYNHGLSDLHQLRGRVGRSNKKAFCYLLSPPLSSLTEEARKRLKAIEEFSNLGGGLSIAMRDLDIRGAGNLLGGEQSGFISEIGFEMYQKILDEALQDLKTTEFKGLYEEEGEDVFVVDCQVETDLEIMLPVNYVTSITERLVLYKELDNLKTEEELLLFEKNLIDRFGPLPQPAKELIQTLRLRWLAGKLGFEKLVLKQKKMVCHFTRSQPAFFESAVFQTILQKLPSSSQSCRMKEVNGGLRLIYSKATDVQMAFDLLKVLQG